MEYSNLITRSYMGCLKCPCHPEEIEGYCFFNHLYFKLYKISHCNRDDIWVPVGRLLITNENHQIVCSSYSGLPNLKSLANHSFARPGRIGKV